MINLKHNPALTIATAGSRKAAKWQNKRTTWQDLVNTLSQTTYTPESIKQYLSYTKDRQDDIKDVGGFVGGYLREGRRKKGFVEHRQVVYLDADFGDLDLWIDFGLLDCAGCMYTTHKHTPEAPRFRLCLPLDRPVGPDEYEAIARVIASWLGIDHFDDTTYQPVRLMYYPSTSKGGEFIFNYTDAPVLKADDVLAELPDWEDPTTWPTSTRVREAITRGVEGRVEDPEGKDGIIGAFCRVYTVQEAIAEFLPSVYTPCAGLGADRYSLVGGSTSGGLVVYDDRLAFSHHSTDAAGGLLCNAFDLVRLHRFGELDKKAKPGTQGPKLPSYKAMLEFAGGLAPVRREILRVRREELGSDYSGLEAEAVKAAAAKDWMGRLSMTGKLIDSTIDNAVLVLNNDENMKGRLTLNEFSQWEDVVKPFPWDRGRTTYPRPVNDIDLSQIRRYLEKCYGIKGKDTAMAAVEISASENGYNPLLQHLDALPEWDGEERLDTLLIRLFGAADTPYTRAVTRKTFCAAIARAYTPGIKFDHVLTLIGVGGNGKSSFLAKMGGEWFTDNVRLTTDDRNNLEIMRGKWILEISEMRGFNKIDSEFAKQFISRTEDIYRRVYKTREVVHRRQSVFIGTHNRSDFLHDETGNRRYWPVQTTTGKEGAAGVWGYLTPETVAQIWAEAKARVTQGEPLHLSKGVEKMAEEVQSSHMETDSWEGSILKYVENREKVTTKELWEMAVSGDKPISKTDQNRIGKIMRLNGWEMRKQRSGSELGYIWIKLQKM